MLHEEPGVFSPDGLAPDLKMAEMALLEGFVVSHIVGSRFIQIWGIDAGSKITWGKEILYKDAGFRGFGEEARRRWRKMERVLGRTPALRGLESIGN